MKLFKLDNFHILILHTLWFALIPVLPHKLLPVLKKMALPFNISALELYITDDFYIASKNCGILHMASPTNILSFPPCDDFNGALILSLDTFARESAIYGQNRKQYFLQLLAHGLMHLAGYEHGDEMQKAEELCLRNIKDFNF